MKYNKIVLISVSIAAIGVYVLFYNASPINRFAFGLDERKAAYNRRNACNHLRTLQQPRVIITDQNNGDESEVAQFAAQFSKSLHHGSDGILSAEGQQNYQQLLTALKSGKQSDFNAIMLAPGAILKFANPQSAFAFSLQGADSSLFKILSFPRLHSPELAALIIENYLMVLCRDVAFNDYGTGQRTDTPGLGASNSKTKDAAAVLQALGEAYSGPRNQNGIVDATVLFRGNGYGSTSGPILSQFLLQPIRTITGKPFVDSDIFILCNQQRPIPQKREFNVTFDDFVTMQNGKIPRPYLLSDFDQKNKRHIMCGRDLGGYVHWDNIYEAFYNAACILAQYGFPFCSNLPYFNKTIINESPFATLGMCDIFGLIGGVTTEAHKVAWAHKWRASRALRPEALSGLVHNAKVSNKNPYHLNEIIFDKHADIDVLNAILEHNRSQAGLPGNTFTKEEASTYLLSQMYPEGAPTHPSYPAAHAVMAGACITVIKAFWENSTPITNHFNPVKSDSLNSQNLVGLTDQEKKDLTVGSELDKLATNIAAGRGWAGVHYRIDCEQGILLGEEVAIRYLQDQACTYNEQGFTGYVLTKRDGTRIRITSDAVEIIAI